MATATAVAAGTAAAATSPSTDGLSFVPVQHHTRRPPSSSVAPRHCPCSWPLAAVLAVPIPFQLHTRPFFAAVAAVDWDWDWICLKNKHIYSNLDFLEEEAESMDYHFLLLV